MASTGTAPVSISVWDVSHLNKPVRLKNAGSPPGWHYRLTALSYHGSTDSIWATLESIEPSPRCGVEGHFALDSIELA